MGKSKKSTKLWKWKAKKRSQLVEIQTIRLPRKIEVTTKTIRNSQVVRWQKKYKENLDALSSQRRWKETK